MMKKLLSVKNDQRGVASLLTVVFFILLSSVITVGFMRMALLESRQSLEDSLSKAALAAAYSGVNDAKRALLYCSQFASGARPAACANLNDQTCPGFFGNDDIRSTLGLAHDSVTNSIQVGELSVNERYTCVTVTEDTFTVEDSLIPDSSEEATTLIPLRSTDPLFNSVTISWHQYSPERAAALGSLTYGSVSDMYNSSYRDPDAIFPVGYEANPEWPALISAHLMTQNGNIDYTSPDGSITGIDQKRWWLFPYGGAAGGGVTATPASASRQLVRCTAGGVALKTDDGRRYHCQMTITGLSTTGTKYLQLTGMYNKADLIVELSRGSTPVTFDGVSPRIDATGAVEDVFRRVQVSVRYEGEGYGGRNPILPNAIDTGRGLCKNFSVGSVSDNFLEDCAY